MKLKEKCIYYNPIQEGYYLVLYIDNEMIYGIRGDFVKTSSLENWINQDGPGMQFKIDDIIINKDYIRNYYLDDKALEKFELVRELSDEEFSLIDILAEYSFPATLIDINKTQDKLVQEIMRGIEEREYKVRELRTEIKNLTRGLYDLVK